MKSAGVTLLKDKQINQQKKQLQARQALTKAQEKMRDASLTLK